MEYYNIIKYGENGGCVRTITDEYSFRANYEPKGWEIEKEEKPAEVVEQVVLEVKSENDEQKVKNIVASKKPKKAFDDNLIKKSE